MSRAKTGKLGTEAWGPLNGLGQARIIHRDFAGAEPYLRQALQLQKDAYGLDNPQTINSREHLALAIGMQGGVDEAKRELESCRTAVASLGSSAAVAVAFTRELIGDVEMAAGHLSAAEAHLREALEGMFQDRLENLVSVS